MKVIITVENGVVTHVEKSDDSINVEIHDYDTDGIDAKHLDIDDDGAEYVKSEY